LSSLLYLYMMLIAPVLPLYCLSPSKIKATIPQTLHKLFNGVQSTHSPAFDRGAIARTRVQPSQYPLLYSEPLFVSPPRTSISFCFSGAWWGSTSRLLTRSSISLTTLLYISRSPTWSRNTWEMTTTWNTSPKARSKS